MSKDFIEKKMPEKVRKNATLPFDIRARKNQQKFQQALTNIEFLPNGEKSIASNIKNQILDEKYFYLKVKNKGEKISPNEIDKETVDEISNIAGNLVEKQGEVHAQCNHSGEIDAK